MAFLFALGILYHLSPPELVAALEEVRRVLQPGGQAVLHFLDVGDWRSTLAPRIAAEQAPIPSYQAVVTCFASQQTIRRWLDTAGLQILSLELRSRASEAGQMRNWIATCKRADKESL
jgi:ubiquinone/menaquinone biosynthesis C-methylase UbiE